MEMWYLNVIKHNIKVQMLVFHEQHLSTFNDLYIFLMCFAIIALPLINLYIIKLINTC